MIQNKKIIDTVFECYFKNIFHLKGIPSIKFHCLQNLKWSVEHKALIYWSFFINEQPSVSLESFSRKIFCWKGIPSIASHCIQNMKLLVKFGNWNITVFANSQQSYSKWWVFKVFKRRKETHTMIKWHRINHIEILQIVLVGNVVSMPSNNIECRMILNRERTN